MSLITLFLVILSIVAITWVCLLIAGVFKASPEIIQIIRIVGIILVVFYVLAAFGLIGKFTNIQVPSVK